MIKLSIFLLELPIAILKEKLFQGLSLFDSRMITLYLIYKSNAYFLNIVMSSKVVSDTFSIIFPQYRDLITDPILPAN